MWKALWADSEDAGSANHTADKLYDLQESTYRSSAKGVPYPHGVVIDLGARTEVGGIQILPRMEAGVPGLPGRLRVSLR